MMKLRGKKSTLIMALLAIFMLTAVIGCGGQQEESAAPDNQAAPELKPLKLATTTSTDDSGLLDYLLPEFQKDTNYQVEVIAVGTGQAIEMGEAGDVDVLLVHSRAAEDKFVADGFGVDRRDVMYNDFLIIGPLKILPGSREPLMPLLLLKQSLIRKRLLFPGVMIPAPIKKN
jgi:tungstate transport system substrate-binding protein